MKPSCIIALLLLCLVSYGDPIPEGIRTIVVGGKTFKNARFEYNSYGLGIWNSDGWTKIKGIEMSNEDIALFLPMELRDINGKAYGLVRLVKLNGFEATYVEVLKDNPKVFRFEAKKLPENLRKRLGLYRDPIKNIR